MSYDLEKGDDRYDGEYLLGSKKRGELVTLAPGLWLRLVDEDNSLKPSGGILTVVFSVPGKTFPITLTNHDLNPTPLSHGEGVHGAQWYTFSSENFIYRIIGTGADVRGNHVYLRYRVTREIVPLAVVSRDEPRLD